jgi:hypothetical protein
MRRTKSATVDDCDITAPLFIARDPSDNPSFELWSASREGQSNRNEVARRIVGYPGLSVSEGNNMGAREQESIGAEHCTAYSDVVVRLTKDLSDGCTHSACPQIANSFAPTVALRPD